MIHHAPIERLVDLLDPAADIILNMTRDEALARVGSGDPAQIRGIDGHFALVHRDGKQIRMARSLGRPLRYFIAKKAAGPVLVVADRIDAIHAWLEAEGLADQFHPSYTRLPRPESRLSPILQPRAQPLGLRPRSDRQTLHRGPPGGARRLARSRRAERTAGCSVLRRHRFRERAPRPPPSAGKSLGCCCRKTPPLLTVPRCQCPTGQYQLRLN